MNKYTDRGGVVCHGRRSGFQCMTNSDRGVHRSAGFMNNNNTGRRRRDEREAGFHYCTLEHTVREAGDCWVSIQ